jgi:hypothetical protein
MAFSSEWGPVRVRKTHEGKNPKPGSDPIRTEKASGAAQRASSST